MIVIVVRRPRTPRGVKIIKDIDSDILASCGILIAMNTMIPNLPRAVAY